MTSGESINAGLRIFRLYGSGKYLSIKHDTYFQVYDHLLTEFVGREVVFVEIGVLNGGSLFMWREFLGDKARIIGIDLNPAAVKWRADGFEIFIGDQSDPDFWRGFFAATGDVDVILDDGGHTNLQQIVTVFQTIPRIRDGGMLIVEDCHASYYREFGNPSGYSFMNFARRLIDSINSRHSALRPLAPEYADQVWSVAFFESIVCFRVDRRRCFRSKSVSNNGISMNAADYRLSGTVEEKIDRWRESLCRHLGWIPGMQWLVRKLAKRSRRLVGWLRNRSARRFFP